MKRTTNTIEIGGRRVEYRVMVSPTAQKLRVRVGANGVDVIQPRGRSGEEVCAFLIENREWLQQQLDRAARLRSVSCRPVSRAGQILFKGSPTEILLTETPRRIRSNLVRLDAGKLIVVRGRESVTAVSASVENWLRKLAREAIREQVAAIATRLKVEPGRLYVMGQRTKWGNCSSMRNLSFNWRIVMAPDFVLRYLVTHEVAHLAVPDHSRRFWLTIQSICPEAERARGWLSANAARLMVNLDQVLTEARIGRGAAI
ncbi:MAG TPA: SprT family zinc-dependent metalloprotease [Myxococcales bacterium]